MSYMHIYASSFSLSPSRPRYVLHRSVLWVYLTPFVICVCITPFTSSLQSHRLRPPGLLRLRIRLHMAPRPLSHCRRLPLSLSRSSRLRVGSGHEHLPRMLLRSLQARVPMAYSPAVPECHVVGRAARPLGV